MDRRGFIQLSVLAGMGVTATSGDASAESTVYSDLLQGGARAMTPEIIPADRIAVYNMGLGEGKIIVDSERSRGDWWLGQFREDPHFMTFFHRHPGFDEHFFVLEGVLSLYFAGTWHDVQKGAAAMVPRGTPHAQGNTSEQAVRFLGGGNPGGFEKLFALQDALLKRMPASDPGFGAEMRKIFGQVDIEILGPPPRRS